MRSLMLASEQFIQIDQTACKLIAVDENIQEDVAKV
jgi:hypothetical protein